MRQPQPPLRPNGSFDSTQLAVPIQVFSTTKNGHLSASVFVVEATGFEPATSASRTQRSTKLSHASICFRLARQQVILY